jgi:hypothetical protein
VPITHLRGIPQPLGILAFSETSHESLVRPAKTARHCPINHDNTPYALIPLLCTPCHNAHILLVRRQAMVNGGKMKKKKKKKKEGKPLTKRALRACHLHEA